VTCIRALALGVVVPTLLVLAAASPVEAQGLGGRLDDPTGRAPTQRHVDPFSSDASSGGAVPAPPSYDGDDSDEASDGSGVAQHHLADRLRALDATWASLGALGVNYTNSVLGLVLGAGQVVIGGVLLEVGGGWEVMAPFFFVTGGVQIVRTILVDFVLRPNPQPIAIEYATMRAGTHAQQLARVRFGEEQLASIAEQSMILRFVDSGINVAGAAALVGAYLGLRNGSAPFEPVELIFFIGPAISTVVAVINLFNPTSAERRWDAYREMRDRQEREVATLDVEPVLTADPRGGGYVGLRGTF